ncbi:hypothetical protein Mapa_013878 [Marchantia paleacea]|nr:hypothetical protein Mapa_013878 [Marchantia paleacea]
MAQKENTVMASIIFASVALLYTASTVNARIGSDNSISCSTSDSSPYLEHAEETVNAIRKLPEDQQCCQLRDPSGCTEMASWFTSKVNICGKKGCTTCRKAGEALNQVLVLAQCPKRDTNDETRVEGEIKEDGFTFKIALNVLDTGKIKLAEYV